MLISHEYNFIFVKTRKTAGTSIELSISPFLAPIDVVTPLMAADSAHRAVTGDYARNFVTTAGIDADLETTEYEEAYNMLQGNMAEYSVSETFYNHMPARRIRRNVGPSIWRNYHTFCVERIPFDRLISFFHFRKSVSKQMKNVTFSEMIRSGNRTNFNHRLYWGPNKQIVNDVIPYHHLQSQLASKMKKLGVKNYKGVTAKAKSKFRTDRRHWSEVINKADRDYISKEYEREFIALEMSPQEAWHFEGRS